MGHVDKSRLGERDMQLREYSPSDCEQIAELFYNTVHSVNAKDYTKEQKVIRQGIALTNYVMEK